MSLSLATLTKKAIEASLKQKWEEAKSLNSEILKVHPNNLDAKIRLGRCYINTKDFSKAKKIYKEVLEVDPINSLALKNLQLAKNQKSECSGNGKLSTKSLLKEPGTTCETKFQIKSRQIRDDEFSSGEELIFKLKKKSIGIYKIKKGKKIEIGAIEDVYITQRLRCANQKNANIKVSFVKFKGDEITVLIKVSIPIFKPDKVEIRPYFRKGAIDEPEMDIEIEEDEIE